ncbi:hypothetical protein [Nodosilinea nodulosa]|uniref:hypothetical protein n=1 Tax=Nodosilinea nodulosa TaxID=416001 RepID=UPI0012D74F89|nr:hypothetical protein [Nodosilinea nodulosa]
MAQECRPAIAVRTAFVQMKDWLHPAQSGNSNAIAHNAPPDECRIPLQHRGQGLLSHQNPALSNKPCHLDQTAVEAIPWDTFRARTLEMAPAAHPAPLDTLKILA